MRIQFAGNGNVRDAGVEADTEAGEAEVEAVDAAKDEAAFSERTFQVCSTRGRLPIPNCRHSLCPPLLIHLHMLG